MWTVVLTKRPIIFPWKNDYFPRKFGLKDGAKDLLNLIRKNGGDGKIIKNY